MEIIRMLNFKVHIDTDDTTLEFEVFPVQDWTNTKGEIGTSYIKKDTGSEPLKEFDSKIALKRFEGSFCWRGIWEGRIYFVDDEYWGSELKEMTDLYENYIVPWCIDFIKKRDPNSIYDNYKTGEPEKECDKEMNFIDKLYENEKELIHEICKEFKKQYSDPAYAIMLENEIVCFTGSDIIDADNILIYLKNKYPDLDFQISNESISFE